MSAPILDVTGLTKIYAGSAGPFRRRRYGTVVDDVSFRIERGDTFGLVGESGSGKSTIGRAVLRLIEADKGSIRFDGTDLRSLDANALKRLRRRMQIIFQDPFSSLDPRVRIGRAIAEPIQLHALRSGADLDRRVVELLALVGLAPHHRNRFPHEFSGGQRQRIAIARALAVEPELIVCDEPVSALDVSIQAQVLNLLDELRRRLGASFLFISHDMAVVRHFASHVGVLYAGSLVETGPAASIFAGPRHPYTRMLLAATPSVAGQRRPRAEEVAGEPPDPFLRRDGCPFVSRCSYATNRCKTEKPSLDTFADGTHRAACWHAQSLPQHDVSTDDERLMSVAYQRRMALLRAARAKVGDRHDAG